MLRAAGHKEHIDPNWFLPIPQPKHEPTEFENFQTLMAFSQQWQPKASEP